MGAGHGFQHLPLLLRYHGPARLKGGGSLSPVTQANREARNDHSVALQTAAGVLSAVWKDRKAEREQQQLPVMPAGIPVLLQVDPSLDLELLRQRFSFEVVAEQEDGYVIVASEDIDLTAFLKLAENFAGEVYGSAAVAQVHRLFDDPEQRLQRLLSDRLRVEWANIKDDALYTIDVGISCSGTVQIPNPPTRDKRDSDATWAEKEFQWSQARNNAYNRWDEIKSEREDEVSNFANAYGAEILQLIDGAPYEAAVLPDSFTVKVRINGKGLRDFVLNYPYIFEVLEADEIGVPPVQGPKREPSQPGAAPVAPAENAPAVCVIDSGIQEGHALLAPAIDQASSYCFLPGKGNNDVADEVRPAGHGTRVAGAVLYGETVAKNGTPQLPFWIQNARVLNDNNLMPEELFPPAAVRAAVERYHLGGRRTRIFNHSINASGYCRTRYMSAWAAEIDLLSASYDVLLIQSAGNIPLVGAPPYIGVGDHLVAGRDYPEYLLEGSARIANPGQSLQALTVGSVSYGQFKSGDWSSFALDTGYPSAFSRSGPSIWQVIKPEVVEFGGDDVRTSGAAPNVQSGARIPEACPELVRSTAYPPGPALDRDEVGTSFAAPKVARLAAQVQAILPDQPALLYRALIVQSARWPQWAEGLLSQLRQNQNFTPERQQLLDRASSIIGYIGYGISSEAVATTNSDYRTTLISSGENSIRSRECHIYQVPIPDQLRNPADEYDIRIDVTLSYVAQPRRTRRNLRRYLSTWVDWKSNRLGEGLDDFRARALRDESEEEPAVAAGSVLPWTLHENPNWGVIRNVKRNSGTVQKDWANLKSNALPEDFCIAVVGHQGWSRDPDSTATYSLAVTFEVLGQEIQIYEPLRTAVIELETELQAEVEPEVEVEAEIEIEEA